MLAQEASNAKVPSFVYISAAGGAPILPQRYIDTKRAAETTIASTFPDMRSIFLRPGFLYDLSRRFTIPLAGMTFAGAMANSLTGGYLAGLMGAGGVKPLKADVVGSAAVEAIADETASGIMEIKDIERLATAGWRKDML